MDYPDVHLPYDDLLLPWALENDLETARIILAVQRRRRSGNLHDNPRPPLCQKKSSDRSAAQRYCRSLANLIRRSTRRA
jgi:hypothetical protein